MNDVKSSLVSEMQSYFGADDTRIDHALRVTDYAEKLLDQEGGAYPVVIAAAVLHDIGIHEAEKKYGSTSGGYQEIEGPPIAREILSKLKFESKQIDEICEIIAHHHSPGKVTTTNFKILYDADWLVNLENHYDITDRKKLARVIDRVFLTTSGRAKAQDIYLPEDG